MGHDKYGIGAFGASKFIPLGQVSKLLTKRQWPNIFRVGIFDELLVFGDGFTCDWVYDRGTEMLNVDLVVILGGQGRAGS